MENAALETRVKNLENDVTDLKLVLRDFILHTESALLRLETEMREFKNEMLDFKDEMREFKDEMLDFKDEMRDFKDEMKDFKDEMREFKDDMKVFKDEMVLWRQEVDKERKEMNRKWGDIANKMGTLVEDIFAPGVPDIAKKYFGCQELEDYMVRRIRKKPGSKGERREFDIIAVCQDKVILVDVKSTVRPVYIDNFEDLVKSGLFFEFFPEYKDKKLIPIFASLYLSDEEIKDLTKRGLYAMAMSSDAVDILNFEEVEN